MLPLILLKRARKGEAYSPGSRSKKSCETYLFTRKKCKCCECVKRSFRDEKVFICEYDFRKAWDELTAVCQTKEKRGKPGWMSTLIESTPSFHARVFNEEKSRRISVCAFRPIFASLINAPIALKDTPIKDLSLFKRWAYSVFPIIVYSWNFRKF